MDDSEDVQGVFRELSDSLVILSQIAIAPLKSGEGALILVHSYCPHCTQRWRSTLPTLDTFANGLGSPIGLMEGGGIADHLREVVAGEDVEQVHVNELGQIGVIFSAIAEGLDAPQGIRLDGDLVKPWLILLGVDEPFDKYNMPYQGVALSSR